MDQFSAIQPFVNYLDLFHLLSSWFGVSRILLTKVLPCRICLL